jgi:hypothetical protein
VRRFKVYRWDPDTTANPCMDTYDIDSILRADGSGCADQDQERNRPDADLPPLLPRGHLRLVRDEHRRHQHAGLHQGHRRSRASEDLPFAAHAGGQGSGAGPDAFLRPVCVDQTLDPHPEHHRRRTASACSPRKTVPSSTVCTNASSAPAVPPPVPATGGTATAIWVRRSCCRPTAGSSIPATRTPVSGWMSSRTRSGSTAATPS